LNGKITFNRKGLVPRTLDDRKKLADIGKNRIIFPLDELLGIAHLPYEVLFAPCLKSFIGAKVFHHMSKQQNIFNEH
jgi:hypothetical protein